VIDQAKAKRIIVASVACVDDNATFSMGTGNDAYGRMSADVIAEQTGGNACVEILGTDQTTPNQVLIVKGFRAQIAAKYPNIKECTWEAANSDAGIAAQKFGAVIAAYPEMNYVWIIEGAAPGAVPSAFAEAGKKPGDIQVLAVDAQAATLQAIRDG
jgi:ABC-type sugar transport system substrate-binding protein